jgi:HlyD family secretion protein
MNAKELKRLAPLASVVVIALLGYLAWNNFQPDGLPSGIAAGNGRIEAVEIDVAPRTSGRVIEVLVDEGDYVHAGQVLARMDTAVLIAQRSEAEAQLRRAELGIETARSRVRQRDAEKRATDATVAQRQAERSAANKRVIRSRELAAKNSISEQELDDHQAQFEASRAAVAAAEAQVAAAEAAHASAKSQVVAAQAAAAAARATIERIQADIDDSVLKSPRDGRVQYRVAQPGEVLPAGGTVLNLVDLCDVYMTFFLPTEAAGRVALSSEARLVFDAAPHYVVPANVSFVADIAQFTPKTVETEEERQKLTFRIKARIDPDLLRKHLHQVKTGLPGMAYVKLDPQADWPPELQIRVPQ